MPERLVVDAAPGHEPQRPIAWLCYWAVDIQPRMIAAGEKKVREEE
jgi:hypothetical protein